MTKFGKEIDEDIGNSSWGVFHIHPVMKFCAMAHAMNERDCKFVLWTDGDGVIVSWNTSLSFDWPGSVKSSSEPWLLASLAGFPQGNSKTRKRSIGGKGSGYGSRLPAKEG